MLLKYLMETLKTIYQRKTRKLKIELRLNKQELDAIPDLFTSLWNPIRFEKRFIRKYLKVDIYAIGAGTRMKVWNGKKRGIATRLQKYKGVVRSLIALKRQERHLKLRNEEIKFILKNEKVYISTIHAFFEEYTNQILRGSPMSLGKGLRFGAHVTEIDNADGRLRMDRYASMINKREMIANGIIPQNLRAGVEGEKWIKWHTNKIRLGSIQFSKVRCNIPNIKYYNFVATQHTNPSFYMKWDEYVFDSIEDIFELNISTRSKLRLIDVHFPEFRDLHYYEYIKATIDDN